MLAEAVFLCDDADAAAPLYDALAPYAARHTQHSFGACWGSVERPLGLLARTLGRRDAAEAHLRAALAANCATRAPVLIAITECDLGELLASTDRERATELGATAEARVRPLGLGRARRPRRRAAGLTHSLARGGPSRRQDRLGDGIESPQERDELALELAGDHGPGRGPHRRPSDQAGARSAFARILSLRRRRRAPRAGPVAVPSVAAVSPDEVQSMVPLLGRVWAGGRSAAPDTSP